MSTSDNHESFDEESSVASKKLRTSDASTSAAATTCHDDERSSTVSAPVDADNPSNHNAAVRYFTYTTPRKTKQVILALIPELEDPMSKISFCSDNQVSPADYDTFYRYLLSGKDKLFGFHMRLLEGQIQIFESNSQEHEITRCAIDMKFYGHMSRHYPGSRIDPLICCDSALYLYPNSRFEADSCFVRSRIPDSDCRKDEYGTSLPNIFIEVAHFEPYEIVFRTAPV
jgi:hypothetical protein